MKIKAYAIQTIVHVFQEEVDRDTLLDLETEGKMFDPVEYAEQTDASFFEPDLNTLGSWQLCNVLLIKDDGTEILLDHIEAGEVPIKNGELVL